MVIDIMQNSKELGNVEFHLDINYKGFADVKQFKANLKQFFKKYKIEVNLFIKNVHISFKQLNEQNGNKHALEHIENVIVSMCDELFEVYYFESELQSVGFPTYKLEWQNILLSVEPNQSISGLDKVIGPCQSLVISQCHNVVGGVLSLLLIDRIPFLTFNTIEPKWLAIIDKHLENERDVLECQEELITNGLRQYAKF
jgi:hypothetical protein